MPTKRNKKRGGDDSAIEQEIENISLNAESTLEQAEKTIEPTAIEAVAEEAVAEEAKHTNGEEISVTKGGSYSKRKGRKNKSKRRSNSVTNKKFYGHGGRKSKKYRKSRRRRR